MLVGIAMITYLNQYKDRKSEESSYEMRNASNSSDDKVVSFDKRKPSRLKAKSNLLKAASKLNW